MECAIRTIRKINFNMGAIKVEDTKRIRFSNMAKFMFNEDQAIIFNRLNGQWIKVPKQCYDILELCNKEGLSWSALSESLADDVVLMIARRKKCGLENSTVIHKVVSTMIPPTLPKLRLGGNL